MIPPELDALLSPLERFEAIRRRVVFLGERLCDLSYGNPYAGAEEATRAVLREALEARRLLDLQYSPVGGHTIPRRMMAAHLTGTHGLPFTFSDVVLTPGATAALHVALRTAGAPGEEVIVPVPCWLDYPVYALHLGLQPVLVPLAEGTFDLDVAAIANAVTSRTCAVLLSHPANPTGKSYDAGRLEALGRALAQAEARAERRITLIADEVHREVLPPDAYRSAAAGWPRTLIVYSFGKYHFLQGQRLGYAAVSPTHPERRGAAAELVRWMRVMGFVAPSALMQRAARRVELVLAREVVAGRDHRARIEAPHQRRRQLPALRRPPRAEDSRVQLDLPGCFGTVVAPDEAERRQRRAAELGVEVGVPPRRYRPPEPVAAAGADFNEHPGVTMAGHQV